MGATIVTPLLKDSKLIAFQAVFYIFVGIAALTLVVCVITVYQISSKINSKKQITGFNVTFLKIMSELYISILYLPSIQVFLYMFMCSKDDNGNQMHIYLKNQKCYEGTTIVYYILGVLMSAIITAFTYVMTSLLYECRLISRDPGLRLNSRWDIRFLLYKLALVLSAIIINSAKYQSILVAVIVGMGYFVFEFFVSNQIFI